MKIALALCALMTLSACATIPAPTSHPDIFMARLNALCGQRFEGRVVTTDAADDRFRSQRLLMHVRDCAPDQVGIPFSVGEDRSRVWIVTRTDDGLRLKHDHTHEDGTVDALHMYGGDTATPGTAERQEFPVDAFSIALFNANDAAVSTTNVWAMEVHPDRMFAYELRRPNRHFRVEFDLTAPVAE